MTCYRLRIILSQYSSMPATANNRITNTDSQVARARQKHRYISPFAAKCVTSLQLSRGALILDLPCGQGRHTCWLTDLGYEVVAVDIDSKRVLETKRKTRARADCLIADADADLPFRASAFDVVLIVHFFSRRLLSEAIRVLRPGGYLIFETFGAQGQNWRSLPNRGEVRGLLCAEFCHAKVGERPAGPNANRAVVQACAQKR